MNHRPRLVALVVVLVLVAPPAVGTAGSTAGAHGGVADQSETGSSGGPVPVTECQMITDPGHYRLVDDITNSSENRCINIQASNVTFDGAGHTIDGVDRYLFTTNEGVDTSTKGVLAKDGPNRNVTVRNVTVTG